jgi:hypothetical protein
MREDGDGRFCERCELRVTDVARLDADGVEELLAAASRGRVCASFELEGGQPRTKLGLAAGLMVATLAGCATPTATPEVVAPVESVPCDPAVAGGVISGMVRDPRGEPIEDAIVVLSSSAL